MSRKSTTPPAASSPVAAVPPVPLKSPERSPRGHGARLRGLDSVGRHPEGFGRFGRMFPDLPAARYGDTLHQDMMVMDKIALTMIKRGDKGAPITKREEEDENLTISSGYTYFGQFIDHDITLDVSSSLDRDNDPGAVEDFRTARLDLDSIYGRGPDDQPYLYNPDLTIKLGPDRAPPGLRGKGLARYDVQRAPGDLSGTAQPECARAIIGDKRNDENSIVVQFHVLFIRLHNRLMAIERAARPGAGDEEIFRAAQRRTRWTYQYLVIHDFVRRIVGPATFAAVWNSGRPDLQFYKPENARYPFMPVEFAVAAYRLGHSMVRPSYALNALIRGDLISEKAGDANRLPIFGDIADPKLVCTQTANLNGFRPLPDNWGIDWSFFFDLGGSPDPETAKLVDTIGGKPVSAVIPQPSYRLDTLLVDPLENLPDHKKPPRSLATLNLMRGVALGLPSGQSVARFMGLAPLTDDELWVGKGNLPDDIEAPSKPGTKINPAKERAALLGDENNRLEDNAPLWFYILREAELKGLMKVPGDKLGGHHLGPVGGRIVAEVFAGLLTQDRQSYLNIHRRWQPSGQDGAPKAAFTMADLIRFIDKPPTTAEEPS
jgi:Animal haem peroxidase